MKLRKVLLSCAIFVVVSLCSFTVAYANVTGQVVSIIPDDLYTSTVGGSTVTTSGAIKYSFPLAGDSVLFDLAQYTRFGLTPPAEIPIDIYFDEPISVIGSQVYFSLVSSTSVRSPNVTNFILHTKTGSTIAGSTSNIHKSSSSLTGWNGYISIMSSNIIGMTIYVTPTYSSTSSSALGKLSMRYGFVVDDSANLDDIVVLLQGIKDNTTKAYATAVDSFSVYNYSFIDITPDLANALIDTFYNLYDLTGFNYLFGWSLNFYDAPVNFLIKHDVTADADLLSLNYVSVSGRAFTIPFCFYYPDRNDFLYMFRIVDTEAIQGGEMQEQLDDATQEASDALDAQEQLESEFQGSMSDNFNALEVSSFAFDTDAQSGLALAGNVFTSIYNAFGKWSILYSFPLLLGVVLLLIGKISKSAGRSSSKGKGDDE